MTAMDIFLRAVYALSVGSCAGIVAHSFIGYSRRQVGSFAWESPFGQSAPVAVVFAGFAVFPVINTMLAVAWLLWAISWHSAKKEVR